MRSYSRRNCSEASLKVFSVLISPLRSLPRSCRYQSSAISLARERLSSFVVVGGFFRPGRGKLASRCCSDVCKREPCRPGPCGVPSWKGVLRTPSKVAKCERVVQLNDGRFSRKHPLVQRLI